MDKTGLYETIEVDDEITLRRLRLNEAAELAALVDANRGYLGHWLVWVRHSNSVADSEAFIRRCHESAADGSEYCYGIFVSGKLAGHMSLRHNGGTSEPEIGYWLDSKAAGRGVTTRATKSLTIFGLKACGFNKIVICAEPGNTASNRVAEKAGYIFRGIEHNTRIDKDCNVWQTETI